MQTLHLWLRDLRAIILGDTPSRWPTPSMLRASTWKTASPLPNPLGPTLAVGSRPVTSHQQFARCPTVGAGLPLALMFREPRVVGPTSSNTRLVCWSQTARHLPPYPAPHGTGDLRAGDGQARASTTLRAVSPGLSFPLRPQRYGARAYEEKTADHPANDAALADVSSGASGQRLRLCSVGC